MKIDYVHAREVLDSRGNPTVEVEVGAGEYVERAMVPSGASTGVHEAVELRDNDKSRYLGKGVEKAVRNVNDILAPLTIGQDPTNQRAIDRALIEADGTENKGNLGANAILGVSMAVTKLAAKVSNLRLYEYIAQITNAKQPATVLPVPLMNIINGGAHSDSNVDFQEFMVAPIGASSFKEALRYGAETFHALKKILKNKGYVTAVGDEGGFAPNCTSNEEPLELIMEAIKMAGFVPGKDIAIALDVASSEFYENGNYVFKKSDKSQRSNMQMIEFYQDLVAKYPIISIEDGLAEDDWTGWQEMTRKMGEKLQLVGDDFLVTNTKRLAKSIEGNCCNSILVKVNQIGSITEAIEAVEMAKNAGMTTIISHRSGETEDSFIADFAVGTNAGQIKTGSLCRSERIAKYNQLLRIEEALGTKAQYSLILK